MGDDANGELSFREKLRKAAIDAENEDNVQNEKYHRSLRKLLDKGKFEELRSEIQTSNMLDEEGKSFWFGAARKELKPKYLVSIEKANDFESLEKVKSEIESWGLLDDNDLQKKMETKKIELREAYWGLLNKMLDKGKLNQLEAEVRESVYFTEDGRAYWSKKVVEAAGPNVALYRHVKAIYDTGSLDVAELKSALETAESLLKDKRMSSFNGEVSSIKNGLKERLEKVEHYNHVRSTLLDSLNSGKYDNKVLRETIDDMDAEFETWKNATEKKT